MAKTEKGHGNGVIEYHICIDLIISPFYTAVSDYLTLSFEKKIVMIVFNV